METLDEGVKDVGQNGEEGSLEEVRRGTNVNIFAQSFSSISRDIFWDLELKALVCVWVFWVRFDFFFSTSDPSSIFNAGKWFTPMCHSLI